MREIQIEELKKLELELLEHIHEICQKEGFRYSLAGGTLLGAVRHGGFIPWDDDIDIVMPRPDYKRFINYCLTHQLDFNVINNDIDSAYGYLFAKAYNPKTILKEEKGNRNDVNLGVYVDIFPLDGLGNSYKEAKKIFLSSSFERELLVTANWKSFFKSKTHPAYYEPIRFVFFMLSRMFSFRKLIKVIEKKHLHIDYDLSQYVGVICGAYRSKEIIRAEVFSEYIDILFEEKKFKAIKAYDTYLKNIYGDYMTLPPTEKRISHHMFSAYYK